MEITRNPEATLSTKDIQKILTLFQEIEQLIGPVSHELDPKKRLKLCRMRDKSQAFMGKAVSYARQLPTVVPKTFDAEGMNEWFQLAMNLDRLLQPTQRLLTSINDARIWSSANAYDQGRRFYRSLKDNRDAGITGVDTAYTDLSQRFKPGHNNNNSSDELEAATAASIASVSHTSVIGPAVGSIVDH